MLDLASQQDAVTHEVGTLPPQVICPRGFRSPGTREARLATAHLTAFGWRVGQRLGHVLVRCVVPAGLPFAQDCLLQYGRERALEVDRSHEPHRGRVPLVAPADLASRGGPAHGASV